MKRSPTVFPGFFSAFLPENAVLTQAVGICPILAVGTSLKYGVALAACTAAVMLPLSLIFLLSENRIPAWLRVPFYTVVSSFLLLIAAFVLRQYVSAEIYAYLYIFLPLMAVNTLVTYRSGSHPSTVAANTLGSAAGFALVLCVASALREMAIAGTLWDIPLGYAIRFPEAVHPFIGFVLLGFMAAALKWFRRLGRRKEEKEAKRL